jgi:molybdate transport repressor ModE-like protein
LAAAQSPPVIRIDAGLGSVMREVQMENIHPLRLKLLIEIERTGSISAAAEICAIGQPSASMHLRTLEASIGQRLVIRTGRGSSLTAAGKIVASHGTRVLTTLDTMRRALDGLDARNGGELTLAASLTPSIALLPRILRKFSNHYPGIRVRLRTLPSATVIKEIARAGADLGIAGDVPTTEPVVRRQIFVDELVGVAPVGTVTIDGGLLNAGEFARNTLLLGEEGSSTRIVTERYLASAQFRPARVWVFDSYEAIKQAVSDGLGVTFMSKLLVKEEVQRGELIAFRITGSEPMIRTMHMVQSSTRELTPEGAAFMTVLAESTT